MIDPTPPLPGREPADRSIRGTWWLLLGAFWVAAVITTVRLLDGGTPVDWIAIIAIALVGAAAILHRDAVAALEARRRSEAESYVRILQGLSRSVSPDAILSAIVDELGTTTAADHLVVVRRRPDARVLEAVLVSRRSGIPDSRTLLPIADLEDPVQVEAAPTRESVSTGRPVGPGIPPPSASGSGRRGVRRLERDPAAASSRSAETSPGTIRPAARRIATAAAAATAAARRLPDRATRSIERIGRVASDHAPVTEAPADPGRDRAARQIAARITDRVADLYGLANPLSAPLRAGDRVIGAIVVSRRTRDAWPAGTRRLLDVAAAEAGMALERVYSQRETAAAASTDALTGLPNRRYFDEFCALLAQRRRAADALGFLMVDIDHFKSINDRFGHAVGDEVLRAVAAAIAAAVRDQDVPARVGGEEFAVLLRNPGDDVAAEVGERIREAVRALDLRAHGIDGVSVSVGVAVSRGAHEAIADIAGRADHALYRAKRGGRDRVVAA